MNQTLKIKIPKKWKILKKETAERWFYNKEKWATLSQPYKIVVVRSLCFWDISFFAAKITKRWTTAKKSRIRYPVPAFHKKLWDISVEDGDMLVICPRGFAKTTAESKIFALWLLLFELEQSILLISSKGLGEGIIGDIRKELEQNTLIRTIWGQLVPTDSSATDDSSRWRTNELQLLSGVEVKTLTKGQAVRGHRPTLIIIDDPEENKDVKNPAIAEEFFQWVWSSLYNALDDGGRMIVLGTVISASCFVNRLKAEADARSFQVFEFPAIMGFDWPTWEATHDFDAATTNATSLWPERWTLPKLKAKLEKLTEKPFFQEFMNKAFIVNKTPVFIKPALTVLQPISLEGNWQLFQELTTKEPDGQGNEIIKKKCAFIGIDMANGAQTGDFSVIMVRDEDMKLLAMYRAKVSQDVLAQHLDWLVSQLEDCFIVPENNMGLAFLNECKNYPAWFSKIYTQETMDKVTNKPSLTLGWNTNAKTKVLMITQYNAVLRNGLEVAAEAEEEILHYYHDEKGGMNGIKPYHDDTVIADALCIQAQKHGMNAPVFSVF